MYVYVCVVWGRVCSLLAIMNSNWTEHLLQLLFAMQNTVDTREMRTNRKVEVEVPNNML